MMRKQNEKEREREREREREILITENVINKSFFIEGTSKRNNQPSSNN